jgi:hypothetical protein
MKIAKILLVLAASTASLGLTPSAAWATRAMGAVVTGEITSAPTSAQIEIAHHVYRIKANSPAAAAARSFYYGQVVDATFDRPAANAQPLVVSIAAHKD